MAWGGARPNSGPRSKKSNPNKPRKVAEPKVKPAETKVAAIPAEAKKDVVLGSAVDPRAWAMMLPEIEELSQKYALHKAREFTPGLNPFVLPKFPKQVMDGLSKRNLPDMAMDNALASNLGFGSDSWLAGDVLGGLSGEGLLFLGYTYLSELAQRPEYRVMSETIADDATRKWIDFDVVGDEKTQREDRAKDPAGYDERMADPDARNKRVSASGKTDRIKELQDDQLRLEVKDRFYEQARNGGFFGRSHLFLDIRQPGTEEMDPAQLRTPIGDSRDATSKTMVQKGYLQGLRTIEPVWTYPLMYNAINPLRKDWYSPQVWFVMGQEIHGSRLQTFIPHPVPDMLKPAYAFGGLSLSQMAKPYVDRWLTTVTSVNQLIHSFSVMVLMTDLSTLMQPGAMGPLLARIAMFNMLRDNQGTFVVNKNTEDFKNVSASLAGLHELQAQAQEHMAFPGRIPLVKFTGIQPAGLNACLPGDVLVLTDRGEIPIRDVALSDRVMTRNGWAPLTFSGMTKYANELIEIRTETTSLKCTPNHPIWLPSINAFVPAENVRSGDRLLLTGERSAIRNTPRPWRGEGNGGGETEPATTSLGMPSRSERSISIGGFGKRIAALYQMAFTSITSIATSKTIRLPILTRWMENSMRSTTVLNLALAGDLRRPNQRLALTAETSSPNSRIARSFAVTHACGPTPAQRGYLKPNLRLPAFASFAALLLSHLAEALSFARADAQPRAKIAPDTVARTIWRIPKNISGRASKTSDAMPSAGSDRVISVRVIRASEPVYDLSVAPGYLPEFFANGILTHNSSEGEIEVYDDNISAYQSRVLDANLRRVVNFEQLSLWGEIDPEITQRWEPLRPMTQAEKGQKEKDDADRNQKYVDMGAISPGEVRNIIVNDKELPYTSLDPDDVPEPPAEEGLLGPGAGGAAAEFEKEKDTAAGGAGGGTGGKDPPPADSDGEDDK